MGLAIAALGLLGSGAFSPATAAAEPLENGESDFLSVSV